ncbi:MAG: DUF547 domain-containing protein [Bacteriovoracia bacterium]
MEKPAYRSVSSKTIIGAVLLLTFGQLTLASENEGPSFDQSHALWDGVLKKYVGYAGAPGTPSTLSTEVQTRVRYSELKKDQGNLNAYLQRVEKVTENEFARFSEPQKLAFLINAYNALTVKLIVDHYPVKSIKEIGGMFSSPWKLKFFTLFGEKHHLNDIEHEMVRKNFSEPRIHFALVCASKGCPSLRQEAFTAGKLDAQLESSAVTFLKDPSRNRFDAQNKTLFLSSIFKWYGGDFDKKFSSVKSFIAPRIAKNGAEEILIKSDQSKVTYLDYDWSLNE